jgi:hypothetical protein
MAQRIRDLRNFDLNLYHFVASSLDVEGYNVLSGYNIAYVPTGVYLVDGFPEDFNAMRAPAIAIQNELVRPEPLQLGRGKKNILRYTITVYGRSDGERDDLGELVYEFLDNTMPIYNYNDVISNGQYNWLGYADFDNIVMRPNRDNSMKVLKHQMNINFEAEICIDSGNSLI